MNKQIRRLAWPIVLCIALGTWAISGGKTGTNGIAGLDQSYLEARVSDLEDTVGRLKRTVSNLESTVSNLESTVMDLEDRVGDLESDM